MGLVVSHIQVKFSVKLVLIKKRRKTLFFLTSHFNRSIPSKGVLKKKKNPLDGSPELPCTARRQRQPTPPGVWPRRRSRLANPSRGCGSSRSGCRIPGTFPLCCSMKSQDCCRNFFRFQNAFVNFVRNFCRILKFRVTAEIFYDTDSVNKC